MAIERAQRDLATIEVSQLWHDLRVRLTSQLALSVLVMIFNACGPGGGVSGGTGTDDAPGGLDTSTEGDEATAGDVESETTDPDTADTDDTSPDNPDPEMELPEPVDAELVWEMTLGPGAERFVDSVDASSFSVGGSAGVTEFVLIDGEFQPTGSYGTNVSGDSFAVDGAGCAWVATGLYYPPDDVDGTDSNELEIERHCIGESTSSLTHFLPDEGPTVHGASIVVFDPSTAWIALNRSGVPVPLFRVSSSFELTELELGSDQPIHELARDPSTGELYGVGPGVVLGLDTAGEVSWESEQFVQGTAPLGKAAFGHVITSVSLVTASGELVWGTWFENAHVKGGTPLPGGSSVLVATYGFEWFIIWVGADGVVELVEKPSQGRLYDVVAVGGRVIAVGDTPGEATEQNPSGLERWVVELSPP